MNARRVSAWTKGVVCEQLSDGSVPQTAMVEYVLWDSSRQYVGCNGLAFLYPPSRSIDMRLASVMQERLRAQKGERIQYICYWGDELTDGQAYMVTAERRYGHVGCEGIESDAKRETEKAVVCFLSK